MPLAARFVLETALQYGGEFAEVYWEHKESTSVSLDGGKVEKINTGIDHGIGSLIGNF